MQVEEPTFQAFDFDHVEATCHFGNGSRTEIITRTLCGIPAEEVVWHGIYFEREVWAAMTFCPKCGLLLCEGCKRAIRSSSSS